MKVHEAKIFIQNAFATSENPQIWADLGCGNGVFTFALAQLLPAGSTIYAVDRVSQQFPAQTENGVNIHFIKADIEKSELHLPKLNGIIVANALHYVKKQSTIITQLEGYFEQKKKFIIIEYDSTLSNQWVPYPIPFSTLKQLFPSGKYEITKIAERSSIYGQGNMYCALITTKN